MRTTTQTGAADFRLLEPGLGTGAPPDRRWLPLAAAHLLIVVGLTGVGKSTTVDQLRRKRPVTVLPNRRTLTDRLIISYLQELDGLPIEPVTDREERFALTGRYRVLFPGGMAHALSTLVIHADAARSSLIFDGLRGANEVATAADLLPQARFAMLHAPDVVRVQRLLGRADRFDRVAPRSSVAGTPDSPLQQRGILLPDSPFSPAEETELAALLDRGIAPAQLQATLAIVASERRNYDAAATNRTLLATAPDRTLYLDTTTVTPAECADRIAYFWSASGQGSDA